MFLNVERGPFVYIVMMVSAFLCCELFRLNSSLKQTKLVLPYFGCQLYVCFQLVFQNEAFNLLSANFHTTFLINCGIG